MMTICKFSSTLFIFCLNFTCIPVDSREVNMHFTYTNSFKLNKLTFLCLNSCRNSSISSKSRNQFYLAYLVSELVCCSFSIKI